MKRGGQKLLVSTTMLAVAACGGEQGKLEIRSTPTALAQGKKPIPYRIAEARGQLVLGNAALALEAFRMAAREDPNSAEALAGMAACYDQMGRFDLSRRNYEAALALAPSDIEILSAFAGSLQLQGQTEEALSVRQEIAARSAGASAPQAVASAPTLAPPIALAAVQVAAAPEQSLPETNWSAPAVDVSAPTVDRMGLQIAKSEAAQVEMAAASAPPAPAASAPAVLAPVAPKAAVQTAALGPSVTIKLPPARRVQDAPAPKAAEPATIPAVAPAAPAPRVPVQVPAIPDVLAPLPSYDRPPPRPTMAEDRGPHLERMSMGEIALITVPKPVWRSTTVERTDRTSTVRFVPLRQASTLPVKVRLLNAARVNRLAARTRNWMAARGWRGMSIGNAMATRPRSVILYPASQRVLAQKLSAQFGFPLARRASGSHVTILLGSDAAGRRALRTGRA